MTRPNASRPYLPAAAPWCARSPWQRFAGRCAAGTWLLGALLALSTGMAAAQETVCARVKIEIKQELTLERQAFDAEMRITNTLADAGLSEVKVDVKITDETGLPIRVTSDPNDTSGAQFFIRVSNRQNIDNVEGTGAVAPNSTATINWLIIPAPGSAGNRPAGKKYLVGATLRYKFGGETETVEVSPDVITVKPLPKLALDYFLTRDVPGDDALTPEVEPVEPFTLGVRVKNNGFAPARNLKIDSAQPRIVENNQGLLINFKLTGSYVDDAPVANTLLLNFTDIPPGGGTKMGRWLMESTLAGTFVEFTAKYSHADEFGGTVTSLLEAVNAHQLIRDVRVDLPGRDLVRDFLAVSNNILRVYESDGSETIVEDRSPQATLSVLGGTDYRITLPPTMGFVYARMPDPFGGSRVLGTVLRSDAKPILAENAWLSKTRNTQTKQWEYWVNVFDVNTTGQYSSQFQDRAAVRRPPAIQFVPNRSTRELQQVSFLVEASSPDGRPVRLSAAPLPSGATFVVQPVSPTTPNVGSAFFDWRPAKGQTGTYRVTYVATDGELTSRLEASIEVTPEVAPDAPQLPLIDAPQVGVTVQSQTPTLRLRVPTTDDPAQSFFFEIYADESLAVPVITSPAVARTGEVTGWQVPVNALNDNTRYWWRGRSSAVRNGSTVYSLWANGRFFVNLANDPPRPYAVSVPANNSMVATRTPQLAVTNAVDPDGDPVTYRFEVYSDNALLQRVAFVENLAAMPSGITSWIVPPLEDGRRYWWRTWAADPSGAQTQSVISSFTVSLGNRPPNAPVLVAPAVRSVVAAESVTLEAAGAADPDGDPLRYEFELDLSNGFTGAVTGSGPVVPNSGGGASWRASGLLENSRYYWRVRAVDDKAAASAWVTGEFFVNAINEAPSQPTPRNPGLDAVVDTTQPRLEVAPATDADGDALSYDFEIFRDAGLTAIVLAGNSSTTEFGVPPATLADATNFWWRARSRDPGGLTSAWTNGSRFTVLTGAARPQITLTTPAAAVEVREPTFRIDFEVYDPRSDSTVSLYYNTQNTGTGTPIVDGLRLDPNVSNGSYVWNVTALPPGTYYIYGVIQNSLATAVRYAPGAIVVPNRTGSVIVAGPANAVTTEQGGTATFTLRLSQRPSADVTMSLTSSNTQEGTVSPATVTFTPDNWSAAQTVTVRGVDDCRVDGPQAYRVVLGRLTSNDPAFSGFKPADLDFVNQDDDTVDRCISVIHGASVTPIASLERLEVRGGVPGRGDWEIGLGVNTQAAGQFAEGQWRWVSGRAYRFTLTYDGSGGARFTLTDPVTGESTTVNRPSTRPGMRTGNAVRLMVKAAAKLGEGTRIAATIDTAGSERISAAVTTDGSNTYSEAMIGVQHEGFRSGFTLGGTITLIFNRGVAPTHSRLNLLINAGSAP